MPVSKGWLQSEITIQTYHRKTQTEGEGGRIEDMEFLGVK